MSNFLSGSEWVHKQRKLYKMLKNGKPCSLSTERALKLADVGFVFDASGYRRGRKIIEEPIPMTGTMTNANSITEAPPNSTMPTAIVPMPISQIANIQPEQLSYETTMNMYHHQQGIVDGGGGRR